MSVSLLFRTPHGRWQWWPILQLVEFVPKGKQKADETRTITLSKDRSFNGAMIAALKAEIKYKEERRKAFKDAVQKKEALSGRDMDARE